MKIHDYRNCFVVNTSASDGVERNTCRTQVLSRCELTNAETGESCESFLGKACIGEHMYLEGGIAQVPTSEVCIIFTAGEYKLVKKFASHEYDLIQVSDPQKKQISFSGKLFYWTDLSFSLPMASARPLMSPEEIIQATLDFEPLVGRTTIWDADHRWRGIIEFPIPYMNVHRPLSRFQVDVGPVLFPDFTSTITPLVSRMELAYVLFQEFDTAEFALRVPTTIDDAGGCETLHYSQMVYSDAQNELFALMP